MVKKLKFFDLKAGKSFMTSIFTVVTRNGRKFAMSTSPLSKTDGKKTRVSRTLPKNFKK